MKKFLAGFLVGAKWLGLYLIYAFWLSLIVTLVLWCLSGLVTFHGTE